MDHIFLLIRRRAKVGDGGIRDGRRGRRVEEGGKGLSYIFYSPLLVSIPHAVSLRLSRCVLCVSVHAYVGAGVG